MPLPRSSTPLPLLTSIPHTLKHPSLEFILFSAASASPLGAQTQEENHRAVHLVPPHMQGFPKSEALSFAVLWVSSTSGTVAQVLQIILLLSGLLYFPTYPPLSISPICSKNSLNELPTSILTFH